MESLLFPILSLGGLGLIFGIILGFAAKKLSVEVDPKILLVRDVLPSANCGGCGFTGCDAYAEAVVSQGTALNLCTVGGSKVAERIGEIMGVSVNKTTPKKAYVKCQGTLTKAKQKYDYVGPMNCLDAANLPRQGLFVLPLRPAKILVRACRRQPRLSRQFAASRTSNRRCRTAP